MKINFKALSLLVVLMMLLSIGLPGCGQKTESGDATTAAGTTAAGATAAATTAQPTEVDPDKLITYEGEVTGTLPLSEEPITLKYWCPFNADVSKVMDSFAEVPFYIELQKITNIKLDFIHPAIKQEVEAFQLMLASQDLPDVIEMSIGDLKIDKVYPGGPEAAVQDGVFLKLNDLVEEHAPNFTRVMKHDPIIEKSLKTDSGTLYAFQMIERTVQPSYGGPCVRIDWLEDLNIDIPETMDDWYEMLKAFRDEKGATSPLLIDKMGGLDGYHGFFGAYDINFDWSQRDGKVVFGPYDPNFKEFIATRHKWYSEKLIDQDFLSHDGHGGANTRKKIANGEAGAFEAGFYHLGGHEDAAWEVDPKFKVEGVPYPVLNKGDEVRIRQYNENVRGTYTVITKDCKNVVETVKLLDFAYSDQGTMLYNYGIEGEHYNLVGGKVEFTDKALNHPAFPGSFKVNLFAKHEGPYIRDYARTFTTYRDNALDAMNKVWNGDTSGMLPKNLTMTADEGTRYSNIMSDIQTYVLEMVPKFIMGVEPMSNYDAYIEQLKKMNVEEAIAIKQASLERFNNR